MTVQTFEEILAEADRQNIVFDKSKASLEWFKNEASIAATDSASFVREFSKSSFVKVNQIAIGKMYAYYYDPKHKATLPYYDQFPVMFPIEAYPDGSVLGINLHYLPLMARVKLMDALYTIENKAQLQNNKRLRVSYDLLKAASRFKWFKPCIKRYLPGHLRSKPLMIPYDAWHIVAFLPLQSFAKASTARVWRDSAKAYRR